MTDELSVRRAVLEAARAHRPLTVELYDYDCIHADCEHDKDDCPLLEVVVCKACYELNMIIDEELVVDEAHAEACPICVAWAREG